MTTAIYSAYDTALLIVDPYNDFMSEGGKLYERTKETAYAVGFYDNMRKLIPAVRAGKSKSSLYLITAGEKEPLKDESI
jgi:hypothetical protein